MIKNDVDHTGRTALMLAVQEDSRLNRASQIKLVQSLLDEGADVYLENRKRSTVWSSCGDFEGLSPLLLSHWDIRHTNTLGETHLHELLDEEDVVDFLPQGIARSFIAHHLALLWDAGMDVSGVTASNLSLPYLVSIALQGQATWEELWAEYEAKRLNKLREDGSVDKAPVMKVRL